MAAAVVLVLMLGMFFQVPSAEGKVTVHGVTITTDKSSYTIGSEAIATAVLDYTGSKKELQSVNFTWYYPNGTIAKSDPSVAPDGTGTAYSAFTTDFVGNDYTMNATYSGDTSIFDEADFDVVPAPPSNMVSGEITVDTTWTLSNSPYIVLDNVSVGIGVTLRIEPGVVVEFKDRTSLTINGTLMAEGNQTNMITFTSNNSDPQPGDWKWINFNDAHDNSYLSYCRIEYCDHGINIFQCSPDVTYNLVRDVLIDGIRAYESSSFIGYNTITGIVYPYGGNKGINLRGLCDTTIEGNVVTEVEEYGIKVKNSNPFITQNYISGSYYNIDCERSNGTIFENTLDNAEITGIRLRECSDIYLTNNTIQGSARKGIECDWSSPTISGNVILENGGTGLDDSGIYLYKSEDAAIVDNYLEDNKNGIYSKNSNFSYISGNEVINSTEDGFYADNSHEIELENNIIDGSKNGIYIKDSVNVSLLDDTVTNSQGWGIYLFETHGFSMDDGRISHSGNGTYLHSSEAVFTKGSLSRISNTYLYLTQNSILTTKDTTFLGTAVQVLGGCKLIVKNSFWVFVEDVSYMPFKGASVQVLDGDVIVYSTETEDNGYCGPLLVTDRIYNGSSTATENVTTVSVENGSSEFENNPRDVDMSNSFHLEIFGPSNPLSLEITYPTNNSLVFDTINITGTASTLSGDILYVDVYIEPGTGWWTPAYPSPMTAIDLTGDWSQWYLEFDTRILPNDGLYKITASSSIAYKPHFSSHTVWVKVDNIGNKGPIVNFTSHTSGDLVNGTITLEGTAFDYDGFIQYVEVSVGNDSFARATDTGVNWSTWSFEINTTAYSNGTYTINVTAFDNASQGESYWIDLVFKNENTTGNGEQNGEDGEDGDVKDDEESDFSLLIILVIIVIVALLLIIIILKKRKTTDEDLEPEEEEELG
jgi:parallel beta-helix repeat protein